MKFKELKENEPLEVIEVSRHLELPTFEQKRETIPDIIELKQIQMRIYTDGEIEKETEETSEKIADYYIGKNKYQHGVDTLKTKNIFLRNHSYVITYLIANEWMKVGNIRGWFDVIKEVSIYLENPKDKKALKSAKQAIKQIANYNNSVDYSSLFRMLFSQRKGLETFETKEISKNVYTLRKMK